MLILPVVLDVETTRPGNDWRREEIHKWDDTLIYTTGRLILDLLFSPILLF